MVFAKEKHKFTMELYQKLNKELQIHVLHMHMIHNVLPEFMLYVENPFKCNNCATNGLPCVYCADSRYCGTLGPPYVHGVRTFMIGIINGSFSFCNMINYIICRRLAIKEVHYVCDLQQRERHRFTPYSRYSVVK
jgi:hypothetical protein